MGGYLVIFALSSFAIIIIIIITTTTMIVIYRCTIFLHGVSHLVVLVSSSLAGKEAFLAHVKVETLQATVPGKVLSMKRPILVIIISMIVIITINQGPSTFLERIPSFNTTVTTHYHHNYHHYHHNHRYNKKKPKA